MSGFTQTLGDRLLDHVNDVAACSQPTALLKVRLMTANGTAVTPGTEVAGGSYTAQQVTFGSAAAGAATNTAAIVYPGMPAATVVGIEIWDSSAPPERLWWGALAVPEQLLAGDTFQFDVGALQVTLS